MKYLAIVLYGLLMSFGLAQNGTNPKLGDYRPVLELARTVTILNDMEMEGLPFSNTQAQKLLAALRGLDAREAITPTEAEAIVLKLEATLTKPQLEALNDKRKTLEDAARRRLSQARTSSTNALTLMSWTVPGGPLMVVTIERNQKLNPFRVRGSQEAFVKLMGTLEKRAR
jgi:hypothetical protein